MINFIKSLFRHSTAINYKELLDKGGLIIDVRSQGEFKAGHIKKSINIPLDQLASNLHQLPDKTVPVIICCASGMRSTAAKRLLISNNFTAVYNGGGWTALQTKLK